MTDYEIYAIRYARIDRKISASFLGGEPEDGTIPMAYYVWLIRNGDRAILVDTGLDPEGAAQRGPEFLISPGDALAQFGTPPETIDTVILTHLHYDHCGNHDLFPNATFHIQATEMAYVTGPWMHHRHLRAGFNAQDVKVMIDRLYGGRLIVHDGVSTIAPGIRVELIGGHTAGLQAVIVDTARGPVVVASDSAVFYEGLVNGRPFPPAFHVGDELKGYRRLLEIAGSADAIIPGHDVEVMARYPEVVPGVAWRVDGPPLA